MGKKKWILAVFALMVLVNLQKPYAQGIQLVGIVEDKLISIDTTSAEIDVLHIIQDFPLNKTVSDITYHEKDDLFYGFEEPASYPSLIRITRDGVYEVIAQITYNGQAVKMAETIAYNRLDNFLYAAVSLNGNPSSNDFWSETIMRINTSTGECTYISEINSSRINPEADIMAFSDGLLYIFDGAPSPENFLDFNEFDPFEISAATTLLHHGSYLPVKGFSIIEKSIFFIENRTLRKFNISSKTMYTVGATHLPSDFNGKLIQGISKMLACVPPEASMEEEFHVCAGESVLLDATISDALTYQWQDGSSDPTLNANEPGVYWVDISNSCGTVRDSVLVVHEATPQIDLGDDIILCEGDVILLNASFPNSSYLWQDESDLAEFLVVTAGTYRVSVTNSCGETKDSIIVVYETVPQVDLGEDILLCEGDVTILNAAFPNSTYLWQNGSEEPELSVDKGGIYWVSVTNLCGSTQDSISVIENTMSPIDLGDDIQLCEGDRTTLNASFPNSTYLWQDGSNDAEMVVEKAGVYWVAVTNACGEKKDSVVVAYENIPQVDLGEDILLCQGDVTILKAAFPNSTYLWQDGSEKATLLVDKTGVYSVTVTNSCGSGGDSVLVIINTIPEIDLGEDILLCEGDVTMLNAAFPNSTYQWQDGSDQPELHVDKAGVYWVSVTNSCGVNSDTLNVKDFKNLFVPNAFTPNNDVFNPYFEIDERLLGMRLEVFNRWGRPVFQSDFYDNKWDGSDLLPDTYYYFIRNEKCSKIYKGWVKIIY